MEGRSARLIHKPLPFGRDLELGRTESAYDLIRGEDTHHSEFVNGWKGEEIL